MHIAEYQVLAWRTAKELGHERAMLHVLAGLAGEVGELSDAIKRAEVYGEALDMENIEEELGDIMWFVAYAATVFGSSLETIARQNINKLGRRYPEKYSDVLAVARLDK